MVPPVLLRVLDRFPFPHEHLSKTEGWWHMEPLRMTDANTYHSTPLFTIHSAHCSHTINVHQYGRGQSTRTPQKFTVAGLPKYRKRRFPGLSLRVDCEVPTVWPSLTRASVSSLVPPRSITLFWPHRPPGTCWVQACVWGLDPAVPWISLELATPLHPGLCSNVTLLDKPLPMLSFKWSPPSLTHPVHFPSQYLSPLSYFFTVTLFLLKRQSDEGTAWSVSSTALCPRIVPGTYRHLINICCMNEWMREWMDKRLLPGELSRTLHKWFTTYRRSIIGKIVYFLSP